MKEFIALLILLASCGGSRQAQLAKMKKELRPTIEQVKTADHINSPACFAVRSIS